MKKLLSIATMAILLFTGAMADNPGFAGPDQELHLASSSVAVLLKVTPIQNAVVYRWFEGTKVICPGLQRWYVIPEVGIHTITCKAYDIGGSEIDSDTLDINVSFKNTTNTGTLSADAGPAEMTHYVTDSNKQIHLMGIATEGSSRIVKEEWFQDGTKIWDGPARWYTLVTPGEYQFTFKVTDANGTEATDDMIITVINGV